MPVTLTEDVVKGLAPDDDSLRQARHLLQRKAFQKPGISKDGTWLLADCQGSAKDPYYVSVDLSVDPPTGRCTCKSRKFPCKHAVGLMLAYVDRPSQFKRREPTAELLEKRKQYAERIKKQASRARKKAKAKKVPKPRKVNAAALAKKIAAQRDGLDLLEKLMIDLVSGGQWFEKSRLERLERQAKQMSDAYLPGALIMLRRLVMLGRKEGLSDEERTAHAADVIAQLWATVQKGRIYLDGRLAGDELQSEADAVMEELLGKTWRLDELKEKGYTRDNLFLYELAYERYEDEGRQEQVQASHLIEMKDGAVYRAITYQPLKGNKGRVNRPDQPSWMTPIAVATSAVYPGFINRRVRWAAGIEEALPVKPSPLPTVYGLAAPSFEEPLNRFRQQLKNALAPREATFLLRCETVGKVGEHVVVEDSKGARIEAVDRRKDYSNVANLVRAAGELRKAPALFGRLFVQPLANTIVVQPLALLTAEKHLRLGL